MRKSVTYLILLLIYVVTSALTCCKEIESDLMLDSNRSWLPLRGKSELIFVDENGSLTSFPLKVIDTIESRNSRCDEYKAEFIKATLYLNASKTDSILLTMESPHFLALKAYSNNQPNIDVSGILTETRQGLVERQTNVTIGNRTYPEAILTLPLQGYTRTIDSIYIANNYGVVGLKYAGKKYFLQ